MQIIHQFFMYIRRIHFFAVRRHVKLMSNFNGIQMSMSSVRAIQPVTTRRMTPTGHGLQTMWSHWTRPAAAARPAIKAAQAVV